MNRWIFAGLMGALTAGCGDDTGGGTGGAGGSTTSTSTGDASGGGDAGGGGPGGGGTGGDLLGGCAGAGECGEDERCDFPDGLCGAGEPGTCVPRNQTCSDTGSNVTCLCGGGIVDVDYRCSDADEDLSGGCEPTEDTFKCGTGFCLADGASYCLLTSDDTGGPDYSSCASSESCPEAPTCECLAAEAEACGGTCEEGEPPTVRCPGG